LAGCSETVTKAQVSVVVSDEKVKVTGCKNHTELASYLLTGGQSSTCRSGTDCKLGLHIIYIIYDCT